MLVSRCPSRVAPEGISWLTSPEARGTSHLNCYQESGRAQGRPKRFRTREKPGNSRDYYQSTGWGAPITAETSFRGRLSNIDVEKDSTVSHINIDKSTRVQVDIVREVG